MKLLKRLWMASLLITLNCFTNSGIGTEMVNELYI